MLKKINRLQKRGDFEWLRDEGQLFPGKLFGMSLLKEGEGENRFGFVISKKISKKAVDRNRIKRLLAEAVRNNLGLLKSKGNIVVYLSKKTMLGKKQSEVEEEVKQSLLKIK